MRSPGSRERDRPADSGVIPSIGRLLPRIVAVLLAVLAAAGCGREHAGGKTTSAVPRLAVVDRVVDGDTLYTRDGTRVRLVQIDAPEKSEHECYSVAATQALERLAPAGAQIRLSTDPALDQVDRYGRLLAYVFRRTSQVNLALVEEGAAAPYYYRGDRGRYAEALLQAARRARAAGRGLWGACPRTRLDPEHGVETER
jgi:micrococcal nuclease